MYINRKAITEYPFHGTFFTVKTVKPENGDLLGDIDGDLLGDEEETETSEETILLETECDIQQAAKMFNGGTIMADYDVYFPLEKGSISPVNLGDMFRCPKESYGISINGRVIGMEISQLGGVKVNIKMSEVG